ncbi:MAG: hypothetical protein IT292_04540 [Deltaproteobacteria bacterium]|nr:hypothetical protein [Deltaproteobacteria bacterium]
MINKSSVLIYALLSCLCLTLPVSAENAKKVCAYVDKNNRQHIVASVNQAPHRYRAVTRCLSTDFAGQMTSSDKIELKGNVRSEDLSSPIGDISLRWPRKVEALFGRTPVKATNDAASTIKRTIMNSPFSQLLRNFKADWKIVFLDESSSEVMIPGSISGCTPGWMTPPANIYVVAQRIVSGCSGLRPEKTSIADEQLARLIIHEMAHGVEYAILGSWSDNDRSRAEGFATWFTEVAAKQNSLIDDKSIANEHKLLAKVSAQESPDKFYFDGSAGAYARSAMRFRLLEKKYGIQGVVDVYEVMKKDNISWGQAVEKRFGLKEEKLLQETNKLLQK